MSEIVFNSLPSETSLQSQVLSFQTTLASLNQQVITLQEALQEKDLEIAELQTKQVEPSPIVIGSQASPYKARAYEARAYKAKTHTDQTLTIIGILINLYRFVFPPGKDSPA